MQPASASAWCAGQSHSYKNLSLRPTLKSPVICTVCKLEGPDIWQLPAATHQFYFVFGCSTSKALVREGERAPARPPLLFLLCVSYCHTAPFAGPGCKVRMRSGFVPFAGELCALLLLYSPEGPRSAGGSHRTVQAPTSPARAGPSPGTTAASLATSHCRALVWTAPCQHTGLI